MRRVLCLLVLFALIGTARLATAKCMAPRFVVSPADGAAVPPSATIRVFSMRENAHCDPGSATTGCPAEKFRFRTGSSDVPAVLQLRRSASQSTWEFTVTARAGQRFVLERRSYSGWERLGTYRVVDEVPKLAVAQGVLGVSSSTRSWTCSHEAATVLTVGDGALAYAIRWAATPDGPPAGEVVLPPGTGLFFGTKEAAGVTLGLGYLNCAGANFEWAGPIYARVVALGHGPHQQILTPDPIRLDPPPTPRPKVEE